MPVLISCSYTIDCQNHDYCRFFIYIEIIGNLKNSWYLVVEGSPLHESEPERLSYNRWSRSQLDLHHRRASSSRPPWNGRANGLEGVPTAGASIVTNIIVPYSEKGYSIIYIESTSK